MSKNNDYLDPMLAGASASLYGLENQEAVKESQHQTLPRTLRKSFPTMCMIPSLKMRLVSSRLQTKQRMELQPKKKTSNRNMRQAPPYPLT